MMLYLAGPDIFMPDARAIGDRKKALCARHGFEGLYPLDLGLPEGLSPPDTAMAIYRADTALMDRADAIVANLTPFRGPSADPGTVFELAWMLARRKPAFGYSADPRSLRDRTPPDGTLIEDFGLSDNLMIACALQAAGTPLITPPGVERDAWWCFEQCLIAARDRLAL
jgi:nucleoside 2-deoxyribosyltransferase